MRWSKIKNIIILLLVIVNLALLALVGLRQWHTAQNERQAREQMVGILANNSITFLPQEVPARLELAPLRLTPEEGGGQCPVAQGVAIWTVQSGKAEPADPDQLTGVWENVTPTGEAVTASTALLRLLGAVNREGYVFSQITDMYPGYMVTGGATLTLTPAWFIEIDTRPWRFAVDGYTGAVTPVE